MGYRNKIITTLVLGSVVLFGASDVVRAQLDLVTNAPGSNLEQVKSYRHLANGVRAQEAGQHAGAYSSFHHAARDGNKTAQFMLGLMYLDATYREVDPLRAWAWMALASERGYPQYAEVAEELWHQLGSSFQPAAREIYEQELLPVYGDKVVIPRVSRAMRRERNMATGSRLGTIGFVHLLDTTAFVPGGNTNVIADTRRREGSTFYAKEKWDFEHLVTVETQFFQRIGTVTITDVDTSEAH